MTLFRFGKTYPQCNALETESPVPVATMILNKDVKTRNVEADVVLQMNSYVTTL